MVKVWAEAGQCEGDVDYARRAVDAIADAGANAIKVQMLMAETLASKDAQMYDRLGTEETQREVFASKAMYHSDWEKVKEYATERGIEFIPSVFDGYAIELCEDWGVETIKIASGDITYLKHVEHAASVAKTLVLSTGGATLTEVHDAIETAFESDHHLDGIVLLACHLEYPTKLGVANLWRIGGLREMVRQEFDESGFTVGYSDHTVQQETAQLAVVAGAEVLEKHFTLLGPGHGTDHEFALGPEGLMEYVRFAHRGAVVSGREGGWRGPEEVAAVFGARRSWHLAHDVVEGEKLTRGSVIALRPLLGGISVNTPIVGRKAKGTLAKGSQIPVEWLK